MNIQVRQQSVYGNIVFRPANEAAKVLAQIAGTKTLTRQTLLLSKQLGATVEILPEVLSFPGAPAGRAVVV